MKHVRNFNESWKDEAKSRSKEYINLLDKTFNKLKSAIFIKIGQDKDWPYSSELYDTLENIIDTLQSWDENSYNELIEELEIINSNKDEEEDLNKFDLLAHHRKFGLSNLDLNKVDNDDLWWSSHVLEVPDGYAGKIVEYWEQNMGHVNIGLQFIDFDKVEVYLYDGCEYDLEEAKELVLSEIYAIWRI